MLVLLLCGCVEEVDSNLRREENAAGREPAADAAAQAPTQIAVTLSGCQVRLERAEAPAGTVAFAVRNEGASERELVVRGAQGEWPSGPVPAGATALVTVALGPGTYQVGCAAAATAADSAASPATLTLH